MVADAPQELDADELGEHLPLELGRISGFGFFLGYMGGLICLVLGMGIPTTAAYVLVAAVLAPAMTAGTRCAAW